jgi:hypothetical protein
MPRNNQTALTAQQSRVEKADPQMGSVLANIQSLLQQLQSMAGAEAQGEVQMENEVQPSELQPKAVELEEDEQGLGEMPPEGVTPDEDDEKKKVVRAKAKKEIITGSPDASTGSGKTEERVEDIPEWDEENIDQIAKAILRMAKGGVRKNAVSSPAAGSAEIASALAGVAKALTVVVKQQAMQGKVIDDLLGALGVTKGLDEQDARTSPGSKPVQNTDQALVMKEFVNTLLTVAKGAAPGGQNVGADDSSPAEQVRKGMAELTVLMAKSAGGLWAPEGEK